MNLNLSLGYITGVRYFKADCKLTFKLWHKEGHYLYCYTSQPKMIDFILTNVERGNFVFVEGFFHDYDRMILTKKVRSYVLIVQDIQFLTPSPPKQFDLVSNPAYRNWRIINQETIIGDDKNERTSCISSVEDRIDDVIKNLQRK